MTPYWKAVAIAVAAESLTTLLVAVGIYFGAAVYPVLFPFSGGAPGGTTTETFQLHFAIPIGMPTLQDLKLPYTFLDAGGVAFGAASALLSIAALLIQSFARGTYLGALRSQAAFGEHTSLLRCGQYFFPRMLAWSVFQAIAGLLVLFLTMAFFPLGLIGVIVLFAFSLTPYLIVLQDVSFGDALASAPSVLRRHFGKLLPVGIAAMIATGLCGTLKLFPEPYDYVLCLFIYIAVGTGLILELMIRLTTSFTENDTPPRKLPFVALPRRFGNAAWVAILLLAPALGAAAVTGQLYVPTAWAATPWQEWKGTSFRSDFSPAYSRSEQRYTAYAWGEAGKNELRISLPELSNGDRPDELRGVAEVTWTVMGEKVTRSGHSTRHTMEEARRTDRLFYRLKRERTSSGAAYYSSRGGVAHLLTSGGNLREPHRIEMMASGDGQRVFVALYPQRFDLGSVWRVSKDGRYLIPLTSAVNAGDFRYTWFAAEPIAKDAFRMVRAKNEETLLGFPGHHHLLPVALQEGDGEMVATLLGALPEDASLTMPDWDSDGWSVFLQSLYEGADEAETLAHLTKAGEYDGHIAQELPPKEEGAWRTRLAVPFPNGQVIVEFEEKDGKLTELELRPEEAPSQT
ncbi:hypothetical protein [Paenibacillus sp.]|uniref:hypothetical protein n=1 Tax=Paenibacillus sp. TaxID=58172 RepID=UPI002D5EB091|nr:hypothetical protein [Paenibacillus sp.]HZG58245.1 hypothetical protein [Paenibacillus sp.]